MDTGAEAYRRYLDGDDGGLAELIRLYRDGLVLYLNGITDDMGAAEELMEDTFVKLAVKKPRFGGKSSFKTWLYAIGRNMALDWLRKNGRERTERLSQLPEDIAYMNGAAAQPELCYMREERDAAVQRALSRLSPDYGSVLYLSYFEGFTNEEIRTIMNKNGRQVENLLYRAKQALKAQLEKEGFVYEEL
ncbi:MAG: RNA polymerase sigma factor [Oscillospiraceae bacterium]|nr:RNA polymerase sigma factor [Oscillospiraceae bacterium]